MTTHEEKVRRTRQVLIDMYRTKRATPRPGFAEHDPRAWENPAPAWVFTTVDRVLPRLTSEPDFGFAPVRLALMWCESGNPHQRAMQIQALTKLWIGPLAPMLSLFFKNAISSAGRRGKKIHGFCYLLDSSLEPVKSARIEALIKERDKARLAAKNAEAFIQAADDRTNKLRPVAEWALRAKWYLDANCSGSDGADRLREELDTIFSDPEVANIVHHAEEEKAALCTCGHRLHTGRMCEVPVEMPKEMVEDIVAAAVAAGELQTVSVPIELTEELRNKLAGCA